MSHVHPLWRYLHSEIMGLSSISDRDFVCLVAQYNDATSTSKTKVSPTLEARGYSPEALAHATKKFSDKFVPVQSCDLRFTKPFGHLKYECFNYVLTLFENYQRGCLPFPGSTSEQPAQIMEIFAVLHRLNNEAEERLREEFKVNGRNQHKNKSRTRR